MKTDSVRVRDARFAFLLASACLAAMAASATSAASAADGAKEIHREDFAETASLYKVEKGARAAAEGKKGEGDGVVFRIEDGLAVRPFDVPEGETLRFRARVRLEGVTKKEPAHYKGARFGHRMGKTWDGAKMPREGDRDWFDVEFKIDVPLGVKRIELQLGLKDATGAMLIKDLVVEALK